MCWTAAAGGRRYRGPKSSERLRAGAATAKPRPMQRPVTICAQAERARTTDLRRSGAAGRASQQQRQGPGSPCAPPLGRGQRLRRRSRSTRTCRCETLADAVWPQRRRLSIATVDEGCVHIDSSLSYPNIAARHMLSRARAASTWQLPAASSPHSPPNDAHAQHYTAASLARRPSRHAPHSFQHSSLQQTAHQYTPRL